MNHKVINKLNLENLYKNGKGRRCGKRYKYLVFQKYGLKLVYDPYGYYCLVETGVDPDEGDYFYYYENEQENDGEVVIDDLGDEVRIYSKSYIGYLDKYNFNLCIDN